MNTWVNDYLFCPEDTFFLIFIGALIQEGRILNDCMSLVVIVICLFAFALCMSMIRLKREKKEIGRLSTQCTVGSFIFFLLLSCIFLAEQTLIVGFIVLLITWLVAVAGIPKIYERAFK